MHSYILVGSENKQKEYLENFKNEKAIPSYHVSVHESFKISDARNLQKLLSLKLKENEYRQIIISSPTLEAQHALLKTLEEVSSQNFIFFVVLNLEDILPTISSRCTTIQLEKEEITFNAELDAKIVSLLDSRKPEEIPYLFGQSIEDKDLEETLFVVRNYLMKAIEVSNYQKMRDTLAVLKKLHTNYKLSKTNNVNKRMVLENSFLF